MFCNVSCFDITKYNIFMSYNIYFMPIKIIVTATKHFSGLNELFF